MSTIGMDLGGTNIRALLLDREGRPCGVQRTKVGRDRSPEAVLSRVASLARGLGESAPPQDPVVAVGIGVAGWVRPEDGSVLRAPNLDWNDVPLKALLEAELGLDVLPMNDLSAVAYGEWRLGAALGSEDALVVFVGTGVGGGLVVGGRLHEGAGGFAGEIGHFPMRAEGGLACGCGRRGCLETIGGGRFIEERLRDGAARGDFGAVLDQAGGQVEAITCAHAEQAAAAQDPQALALWQEVSEALAAVLAGMLNLLDPEVLVLGGGVMEGCTLLRQATVQRLRAGLLPPLSQRLRILRPGLGDEAGVLGAAWRARDEITAAH